MDVAKIGTRCLRLRTAAVRRLKGLWFSKAFPRRLDAEEARGVAVLDAAPELPFGGDNEMLVERIGMGGNFDPFPTAGDDGQHG